MCDPGVGEATPLISQKAGRPLAAATSSALLIFAPGKWLSMAKLAQGVPAAWAEGAQTAASSNPEASAGRANLSRENRSLRTPCPTDDSLPRPAFRLYLLGHRQITQTYAGRNDAVYK